MLRKFCKRTGCKEIVTSGYCDAHKETAQEQSRERHKSYDRHRRDQQSARFYASVPWRRLRKEVWAEQNGLCQECLESKRIKQANVADHTIPIKDNWSLRLRKDNIRLLCHACHNRKTAEDRRHPQFQGGFFN